MKNVLMQKSVLVKTPDTSVREIQLFGTPTTAKSDCCKMKQLLTLSLTLFFLTSFAQKEDRNWVFGDSTAIDFNNLSNPTLYSGLCHNNETNCSISDRNGNLKMYLSIQNTFSYYSQLRNSQNQLLINGDSIKNYYSASNGAVFIPFPNDTNKFYFFSIGLNVPPAVLKLNYTVIDFSQSNDGEVISKNNLLIDSVDEHLLAIKHGNGRDWWLIARKNNTDSTVKFLVTTSGIEGPFYQKIGSQFYFPAGESSVNSGGNKISFIAALGNIDVYDFDRCTGALSNYLELGTAPYNVYQGWSYYGCCFSPDGNRFYVGRFNDGGLVYSDLIQYTINNPNPLQTKTAILDSVPFTIAQMELAPDDKIYIAGAPDYGGINDSAYKFLSVINNPNDSALACNLDLYSFYLGGHKTHFGLPNMPNYNLGKLVDSPCDTIPNTIEDINSVTENIFSVYPNPNDGLFSVSSLNQLREIKIADILGRTISIINVNEKANKLTVDLSIFSSGIYLLTVNYDLLNNKTFKIIIAK